MMVALNDVRSIFENNVYERIIKSESKHCNIDTLVQKVMEWKKQSYKIVFTAGVFDIFTINHLISLYHYRLMGGNRVKLILSVDTDTRVKNAKAFKKDKGNAIKPILSWDSRVLMLAKQSFLNVQPLVDLIVQHGSDTCDGVRCPHDDNVTIAEIIKPDIIIVTSSSIDTISKLKNSKYLGDSEIVIIREKDLSYKDTLIEGNISTSSLINRIKYANS